MERLQGMSQKEKTGITVQDILVFVLCYGAYATAYLCRANFAIALPQMVSKGSMSKIILGSIGGAFFWTYAIGQLVHGILGDIVSPRLLVGGGILTSGLCNIIVFLFPTVKILTVCWIINGFALAALWGPIIRTVSLWYTSKMQSTVALALNTSMVVGYFLAWGGLSNVTQKSWGYAFLIPGTVGVIMAIAWIVLLPRKLTSRRNLEQEQGREVTPKRPKAIKSILNFGIVPLILIIICTLTQGIIKDGISLWGPTLIAEYTQLSTDMAAKTALLIPLASLLGMFIAGIGERLTKSDDGLSFALLLALSGLSWSVVRFGSSLNGFLVAVFISLAGAFAYGANTVLLVFVPLRLAKTGKVSSIAGILDFVSYVGASIAGPLAGYLAESGAWSSALSMWFIIALVGAVSAMGIRRVLARGTDKREASSV